MLNDSRCIALRFVHIHSTIFRAMPNRPTNKLVYVTDAEPGYRRKRSGRGFRYLDARGRVVRNPRTLARIRALAIPPAYVDVWICVRGNGHLQATGRDARGRKQYRYHALWNESRRRKKFGRIEDFGKALPKLRRVLRADLRLPGIPERKVLAVVVSVMADTLVRVGNGGYARENKTYGLTTLRKRHVRFLRGGRAMLRFRGKGGIEQEAMLDDDRLVALVRRCQQLPGQHLFQYRDDDGKPHPIDSTRVNDYLRDAMDGEFTAKDFRTWGGTLSALRLLAGEPWKPDLSERGMARVQKAIEAEVSNRLGNTPAVCRKSYIDPRVYVAWREGSLARMASHARGSRQWETLAVRLLHRHSLANA